MLSKYVLIVLKKELKDTFRDKKTIITGILLPILILPILAFVMGSGNDQFLGGKGEPIAIRLISEEENSLTKYLRKHEDIKIKDVKDSREALEKLDILAIVKIKRGFTNDINSGDTAAIEITFDESSQKSFEGASRLQGYIGEFSKGVTLNRLNKLGINPEILKPIDIKENKISTAKGDGMGLMLVSMILPMLLTMWAAIGGLAAATDLGAGEKERQTLEPLLTTRASRLSLLMGKYLTVFIVGMLGTLASLGGYIVATKLNPNIVGVGINLPLKSIIVIGLLCIGLSLIFSGFLLAISFYARSFKEAQTYLSPLTIALLIPAYFTMFMDGKAIPDIYFHIPIVNTIAIIKQSIVSVFSPVHILIVSGWTIVYLIISLFITVNMINKESVIFRS